MSDDPIGGGDGLPEPKNERKYGSLPLLTRRQTYHLVSAIPVIQLAVLLLLFIGAATDIYTITHKYIQNIIGFSLITGIYQWYSAKFMGSCGGAMAAIYTLIALNLINILHLLIDFNYYFIYGAIITGVGLLLSAIFYKR